MLHSNIDPQQTLGSLVSQQIGRARVLEWFGLDYCCGGGKSLEQACIERELDPATVSVELLKADESLKNTDSTDWKNLSVRDLIENIITTHHTFLRLELPRLSFLTSKIADVHGQNHPELLKVRDLFAKLRSELEPHMKEEEESLFPTLRLLHSGGKFDMLIDNARGNIRKMEDEHVLVGDLLSQISTLTAGYNFPADGCETYRVTLHGLMTLEHDIHLHVHKENNLLFPKAILDERAA